MRKVHIINARSNQTAKRFQKQNLQQSNLINAIKEQTLNYQDTRYEMEIIDNSLTHFLLTKQKDKELHKYTKRFKSSKQVLKSQLGGPIKFTKYVSKMDMFDPAEDKKIWIIS